MNAGSVSAAAEQIYLTQSSVSRLLAGLEEELGFKLFYRRGRRLVPSVEGKIFYQRIEGTLAAIDDISTIAEDVRRGQGLRLRVCAIGPLVFSQYLSRAMRLFTDQHPDTIFTVEQQPRIEIDEWVASRKADLGLTLLPVESLSVGVESITTVSAVSIIPTFHPLAEKRTLEPPDLEGQSVILPKQSVRLRQMADGMLLGSGVRFASLAETSSAIVSCQMVAQGLGVGISDPFSVYGIVGEGLEIARWRPELKLTYGALWPKDRTPSDYTLELIEILKTVSGEMMMEMPEALPDG